MKHIYLLQENFNGTVYGIGTYLNVLLKVLLPSNLKVSVICLFSDVSKVSLIEKDGYRSIYIPKPKSANAAFTYYQNVFYILYPYINSLEENIIHIHYRNCRQLIALLREYLKFKVVLTWHFASWLDYFSELEMKDWFEKIETRHFLTEYEKSYLEIFEEEKLLLAEYCDCIIALAKHASDSLQRYYKVPMSKIRMIHNSVEDMRTVSDEEIKKIFLTENEKTILFVGRLDNNKNPFLILKAFHKVVETLPARLIVVGYGSFDIALKHVSPHYKNILFTGFLSPEILHQLYEVVDIGVIPSHYEEFGYVAIEMMMHGIPIIANDTSGLKEIIENGVDGDLINLYAEKNEERSVCLLAESIISLLLEQERMDEYSVNARKKYVRNFTMDVFKNKMLNVYDNL